MAATSGTFRWPVHLHVRMEIRDGTSKSLVERLGNRTLAPSPRSPATSPTAVSRALDPNVDRRFCFRVKAEVMAETSGLREKRKRSRPIATGCGAHGGMPSTTGRTLHQVRREPPRGRFNNRGVVMPKNSSNNWRGAADTHGVPGQGDSTQSAGQVCELRVLRSLLPQPGGFDLPLRVEVQDQPTTLAPVVAGVGLERAFVRISHRWLHLHDLGRLALAGLTAFSRDGAMAATAAAHVVTPVDFASGAARIFIPRTRGVDAGDCRHLGMASVVRVVRDAFSERTGECRGADHQHHHESNGGGHPPPLSGDVARASSGAGDTPGRALVHQGRRDEGRPRRGADDEATVETAIVATALKSSSTTSSPLRAGTSRPPVGLAHCPDLEEPVIRLAGMRRPWMGAAVGVVVLGLVE